MPFDVLLNSRYPGEQPTLWYLIPSVDVVNVIFSSLLARRPASTCGSRRKSCAVASSLGSSSSASFASATASSSVTTNQRFNFYTDLPLVPELVRFTYASLSWWQFSLLAIGVVGLLFGFFIACYRALDYAEGYLRDPKNTFFFGAATSVAFVATLAIGHRPENSDLYRTGFAASATPRLRYEVEFLRNVYWKQADEAKVIARTEARLSQTPSNLLRLAGKNVHLILVESYGQTVIERPLYTDAMRATFDSFESVLGASGYSIVSSVLDSPTYGGHSWLALATLDTGIRTANQLDYEVVCAEKPKAIAGFFHDAGVPHGARSTGNHAALAEGRISGF